ncbi:hypothetical protein KSP39_PZI017985 [Platanthera zijinensis]|uniref:Late embryogenesis abundant protein LEA-2 subgroup domain-containing protein n=1 Tax=Platanthera zijinensis TaxID=2320716 RepID=A0AAP0FZA9_9ASPA
MLINSSTPPSFFKTPPGRQRPTFFFFSIPFQTPPRSPVPTMTESKEGHLNQPYYGPAIPPAQIPPHESHPPPGREFDAYSLICAFTRITTIFIIIIGLIVLALWLIYQPQSIKVFAETASLSTFNLSAAGNDSLLTYNVAVNFTFRNPNRKYSIYYERLDAQAFYGAYRIGSMVFPRIYQRRKDTMPVSMALEGRVVVASGDESVAGSYSRAKGEGFFNVRVKMYVVVRLKMVVVKSVKFKPDVDCDLWIPAPGNATSLAAGFARTKCDVNNFS